MRGQYYYKLASFLKARKCFDYNHTNGSKLEVLVYLLLGLTKLILRFSVVKISPQTSFLDFGLMITIGKFCVKQHTQCQTTYFHTKCRRKLPASGWGFRRAKLVSAKMKLAKLRRHRC